MAGRGFPPKDPGKQLGHRSKTEKAQTHLGRPTKAAPALPGSSRFLAATRRWYRTWAHSPQASTFTDTDWQRLHMLAPLVDEYFAEPDKALLAEIRLNEAALGATPADRLRLHWSIDEGVAPSDGPRRSRSRERKDPRHLAAVK